jgi:hypothetical protein
MYEQKAIVRNTDKEIRRIGDTPQDYLRKLKFLQEERQEYEQDWKDIRETIMPRRGRFLDQGEQYKDSSRRNRGRRINGFATRALRLTAGGIFASSTSPGRKWQAMALEDPNADKHKPFREYLDRAQEGLFQMYRGSNFYQAIGLAIQDIVTFGTTAVFADEHPKTAVHYNVSPMGQYYLEASEGDDPDTVVQLFSMPATYMLKKFGPKAISSAVAENLRESPYHRHKVVRVVEPNPDHQEGNGLPGRMPYRVRYFEHGEGGHGGKFLDIGGYEDKAFAAARWATNGESVYGEGPCHDIIDDVLEVQALETDILRANKKTIDPPLVAPPNLRVNLVPGGITRYEGTGKIESIYNVQFPVQHVQAKIEAVMKQVSEALYNDVFLLALLGNSKTAYEVSVRQQEKMLLMGPIIDRVFCELLNALSTRSYNIGVRTGRIPPPPPDLINSGLAYRWEYLSPLAQAQKALDIQAIDEALAVLAQATQWNPAYMDIVNVEQALEDRLMLRHFPAQHITSQAQRRRIREQRAQDQQAIAAQQQAMGAIEAAKEASQINTQPGNAVGDAVAA